MPFVSTSRRFPREYEALAQDCGAYAMKYGRIWFPVVHGSHKWMDTVAEKQCRDGEDSRKMRMVATSKETARLAGSKDCDRQPSFVNCGEYTRRSKREQLRVLQGTFPPKVPHEGPARGRAGHGVEKGRPSYGAPTSLPPYDGRRFARPRLWRASAGPSGTDSKSGNFVHTP